MRENVADINLFRIVMYSHNQAGFVSSNVKNGVFTYHILEAINDSKTDSNSDKFISIIELSNKLKEPANNADYQYPIIRNVGNDVMIEKL